MVEPSVRNPYAIAVACIFLVLAGVMALRELPLQLRPTVEPPEIQIATSYPGSAPPEVEDQITRRIEEQLTSVNGLKRMLSTSSSGRSAITLEFEDGVDRDAAMVDVLNKLGGVQGLPPEADPPEATATTSDQQAPMMWIGVRGPEEAAPIPVDRLRAIVDDVIAPRIRRVDGVAGMIVAGGQPRELHVLTDFEALAARGVGVLGFLQAVGRESVNARGGPVWLGKREYTVRTQARAETPADFEDVLIRRDASGTVRLGDVARVLPGSSLQQSLMRQNGIPAVALGIQRQTGANVPSTVDGVRAAVDELHRTFEQSGVPVRLRELYSETTYIDEAVAGAVEDVVTGLALAALALWLTLRSGRAVALVAVAQPLAVVAVFPVLWLLDRSLNIITLAGLAFAVGITVDNAIVVVENIHRHRELGKDRFAAAIAGAREVGGAMLAATLTNICVFAPVVLLGGEAGQIFRDLAIGISVAAVASLAVVLTAVPTAAARWGAGTVTTEGSSGRIGRLYGAIVLAITAPRPWARLGVLGGTVAASLLGLLLVPSPSYLPEGNRNLILTFARPLPGTSAVEAGELLAPIERSLLADERVERTFVVLNTRFMALGTVLKPEFAGPGPFGAFLGELRGRVSSVPGFRFLFPRRASIFQDPGKQFEVYLSGPDLGQLASLSGQAMGQLKALEGVVSVRSNFESGSPELQVVPDRRRLAEVGLRAGDLATIVETAVGGRRVGTFLDEGRELDVVVVGDDRYREDPASLAALPVLPGVRLDAVARVVEAEGPVTIPHLDQERAVTLQVSLDERAPLGEVIARAEAEVLDPLRARLEPGYYAQLGGTADRLAETMSGLGQSFLWAVSFVYLLLVALYRSWSQPLVILTAVPLGVCGALLALAAVNLWTPVEFDTIAMLGMILLAGVVVNTSILIVSQSQEFVAQGLAPREALHAAAVSRLRPILMSVVTSVIGMLPLAAGTTSGSELYRGLGVVMVGGLVLSTLLVPLAVPALLALSPHWRKTTPAPPRAASAGADGGGTGGT